MNNTLKFIVSILILVSFRSNIYTQIICNLEKRDGIYAEGGGRKSYSCPGEKEYYRLEKKGDDSYDLIDKTGVLVKKGIKKIFEKIDRRLIFQNKNGKWGVYNKDLSILIRDEYDDLYYETIEPRFRCLVKKNQLWGIVDSLNNLILPINYDNVQLVNPRLAFLEKGSDKFLYFFEKDKLYELNDFCIKNVDRNYRSKTILIINDSLCGAMNMFGELIIKPEYEDLTYRELRKNKNEFYFIATNKKRKGIINKFGKPISSIEYEKIREIYHGETVDSSVFALEKMEKIFISYLGKTSNEYFSTILTKSIHNHQIIISKMNYFGLYDYKMNKLKIPPIYEELSFLKDSIYTARKNGKYGIVSSSGKVMLNFEYDIKPQFLPKSKYYPENYIKIRKDGLFGYVNENFDIILKPKYHVLRAFSEGMARVMKNYKWGYIDENFVEIIKLKYEYAKAFKDGKAEVVIDGKERYINKKGAVLKNEIKYH